MSELPGQWGSIEQALERLDRQVVLQSLRPGIDSGDVQQKLNGAALLSSDKVQALYGWHA